MRTGCQYNLINVLYVLTIELNVRRAEGDAGAAIASFISISFSGIASFSVGKHAPLYLDNFITLTDIFVNTAPQRLTCKTYLSPDYNPFIQTLFCRGASRRFPQSVLRNASRRFPIEKSVAKIIAFPAGTCLAGPLLRDCSRPILSLIG